jgi:hypothetical protein
MAHLLKNKEEFKRNIKVSKANITQIGLTTSDWQNVEGSQISYTPASGSDYVIYEFTTVGSYNSNMYNNITFQLQYGSDINNLANITTNNVGYINQWGTEAYTGYTRFTEQITLSYTIPTWNGEKVLVTQAKTSSSAHRSNFNGLRSGIGWDGNVDLFNSFVIIYSK